jgi:hypothetical protein
MPDMPQVLLVSELDWREMSGPIETLAKPEAQLVDALDEAPVFARSDVGAVQICICAKPVPKIGS